MNIVQITIHALTDALAEAQEEEKQLNISIASMCKELMLLETKRVGIREEIRLSADILRETKAKEVREEVYTRHVDIAHMKGHEIQLGDELTENIKSILRS